MKKYVSAITSAIVGILTFILLSLNWMTATISNEFFSTNDRAGVSGWELLDETSAKGASLYKLSVIIMIILSVLLVALGVIMILQNLNIIKTKFNFNKINNVLVIVFVVFVILAFISAIVMASDSGVSAMGTNVKFSLAIGGYIMIAVSVIACVVSLIASKKFKN